MSKIKGFTFIELVLTIIILSIIAAIGSKIIQASFSSYLRNQYITDANAQARLALERMIRDIHSIRSADDITTATSSELTFNNFSGNSVDYVLTGTQLMRNSTVIADGVSSFSLSYLDQNGASTSTLSAIQYIIINLNLNQNGVNYSLRTTVSPLNYQ